MPKTKWLTWCSKPVEYFQGSAFLFCAECLDRAQAGEPVLPCEPWSDEDAPPEERYAELFRIARVLFDTGVTEEAEIIPTLVFAGRSWEMPILERIQHKFVEAGDDVKAWEELRSRFGEAFRSLCPERVVSGALIVFLKEMYLLAHLNQQTDFVENISVEVYRRSAKPDVVARLYKKLLELHDVPYDTDRGCFSWMAFNGFLRLLIKPEDVEVHSFGKLVVATQLETNQLPFPHPDNIRDYYKSLLGSMHKKKGFGGFAYALADKQSGRPFKPDNLIPAVVAWFVGGHGKLLEQPKLRLKVAQLLNEHLLRPCGQLELPEDTWLSSDTVWRDTGRVAEYVLRVDYELRERYPVLCTSFQKSCLDNL